MSIFRRDKATALTLEEKAAIDLGRELEGLSQEEIRDFSDRIFEWMPILVRQASRQTGPGFARIIDRTKYWGKKLLVRRGAMALTPGCDGGEVFGDSLKALLAAFEKHAPQIQRIFVEQVQRYRDQQEILRRPRLESAPASEVIEIEAISSELKQLGPVDGKA